MARSKPLACVDSRPHHIELHFHKLSGLALHVQSVTKGRTLPTPERIHG